MQGSESIINNLLIEVDSLTYRLRNIKQCFKSSSNIRLRKRLISENTEIYERVSEIYKISKHLNQNSNESISFSALLVEKCIRSLEEAKTESNLFF